MLIYLLKSNPLVILFFIFQCSCQSSQWKHAEAFVSVIDKYADTDQGGTLQRSQAAVMATVTTLLQDHNKKQDRGKGGSIVWFSGVFELLTTHMNMLIKIWIPLNVLYVFNNSILSYFISKMLYSFCLFDMFFS